MSGLAEIISGQLAPLAFAGVFVGIVKGLARLFRKQASSRMSNLEQALRIGTYLIIGIAMNEVISPVNSEPVNSENSILLAIIADMILLVILFAPLGLKSTKKNTKTQ